MIRFGRIVTIAIVFLTAGALLSTSPAAAQSKREKAEAAAAARKAKANNAKAAKKDKRRGATASAAVGKKLTKAQELLQADKPKQAIKELDSVAKRRGLKPVEIALTNMLYGYAANSMDDQKGAIDYFTKAIKERALPIQQELNLEYVVGQLYMMQEDFPTALRILRGWFKKVQHPESPVKPSGSNYYLLALCYIQLEEIDKARKPAELAVASTKNPQETWLRLLGQIYYSQKEYKRLAKTVEMLIVRWPKPEYYKQLSGAYAESGQELKSLAVLQLAHTQGITSTEPEIRHLAQSYLFHEIPYRAALVMEKGFEDKIVPNTPKNLQLLADSWLMAREPDNAFEPLAKAAELSGDAETYMRLAQAYVGREKWEEADRALSSALEIGVKDPGSGYLLQGLARMNLKRWSAANASFDRAMGFPKQKASATSYKSFLKTRKEQYEILGN